MARRRLTPATPQSVVPHAEPAETAPTGFGPLETKAITRLSGIPPTPPRPPIASVAAEAAGAAALAEMEQALRSARETGRLVVDLPLAAIAPDHLTRDRLPCEDAEMAALRASLRAHGQRVPIEVTPLETRPEGNALPYGLISGWRRLEALRALHAATGEARFATVRALIRRPETARDAYVAMVEENELRVGLSQYERARVAARAAARGVFPDEEAALQALFGGASKAKLSRIRSFIALYHGLDDVLRYPAYLPERLGLALVEALRAPGGRARITAALERADPADPAAERAALTRLLAPAREAPPPPETIRPGVTLETRLRGQTLTLRLSGPGVTEALAAELRAVLARG